VVREHRCLPRTTNLTRNFVSLRMQGKAWRGSSGCRESRPAYSNCQVDSLSCVTVLLLSGMSALEMLNSAQNLPPFRFRPAERNSLLGSCRPYLDAKASTDFEC
jgi:hypothetical protein